MRDQSHIKTQAMVKADNPKMMAEFCKGYAPLRDGMRSNRDHWTERAKAEGLDMSGPKAQKKEEDYGNLWEKYLNMGPENHIWGMDTTVAPPEDIVIERVVFSPKKGAAGSPDEFSKRKPGKGKRHKKFGSPMKSSSTKKSSASSVNSDSSSKSRSVSCCIM